MLGGYCRQTHLLQGGGGCVLLFHATPTCCACVILPPSVFYLHSPSGKKNFFIKSSKLSGLYIPTSPPLNPETINSWASSISISKELTNKINKLPDPLHLMSAIQFSKKLSTSLVISFFPTWAVS